MTSPRNEFGLSVDEFALALRDAVHDVKHEQTSGQGLRHFWDFSCLYPLLSADNLRATHDAFPQLGRPDQRRELLTLALFSAGMTGSVSLLPPHVAEFHKEVETEIRSSDAYQERLVTSWLITSSNELDEFYDQLQRAVPAHVAEIVAKFDIEQAIAAQLLSVPSTARRVRSWLDRGQLDIRPPALKPDFNPTGGIFAEVLAALSRERTRPDKREANLTDSVAVHMLAHLNGLKEFPYPRFFSSSPALNRVLRRRVIADNFTYDCNDAYGLEFTSSIVRDTTYYYVRSIFPALNWKNADQERSTRSPVDYALSSHNLTSPKLTDADAMALAAGKFSTTGLDELADLSANLNQALRGSKPGIVDTIYFQGRPIGELLAQMRTAGSKASLINVPTERFAKHLIDSRVDDTTMSETERARLTNTVRQELATVANRARQHAATAAATVSTCTLVATQLKRLTRHHAEIDKLDAVSFVQAELFAYRWSHSTIEPEYAEALYNIAFPPKTQDPAQNPASYIIPFATPANLHNPSPKRWQWLATLYSAELFNIIAEIAPYQSTTDAIRNSNRDTTSSLITLAAHCRVAEQDRDSIALANYRDAIYSLWGDCKTEERDELLLGFGSALLHSHLNWQAALGSANDLFDWPDCRKIGEHAVARAQALADLPQYPFVVNFICVLNLYGQVAESDAKPFWPMLETFAVQGAEGSYRMTDTIALMKFVNARRVLDMNPADPGAIHLLSDARNDIRQLLRQRYSTLVAEHHELVNQIYRLHNGGAHNV